MHDTRKLALLCRQLGFPAYHIARVYSILWLSYAGQLCASLVLGLIHLDLHASYHSLPLNPFQCINRANHRVCLPPSYAYFGLGAFPRLCGPLLFLDLLQAPPELCRITQALAARIIDIHRLLRRHVPPQAHLTLVAECCRGHAVG